jgi:hypothetical protein
VHVHVYTYACIHMCHVCAEGVGFRDQGSGIRAGLAYACMYTCMCMYEYWCIYVGSCNICIPTGCICNLHIYLEIYVYMYMHICMYVCMHMLSHSIYART